MVLVQSNCVSPGQDCFGGIETFEKTTGQAVGAAASVLTQQSDQALTRDCVLLCRQSAACSAFTLEYDNFRCVAHDADTAGRAELRTERPNTNLFEKICFRGKTFALINEAYEKTKKNVTNANGRKNIADDSRSGRQLTSTTDRNIGQVRDLIVADRKITIDNISEILGISYGSCQKNIGKHLNMKKLCGYFVP
ncbi:hypothetical protein LAZ67_21001375 [Cordylochernes scorpioides]|uniref:Apple domain-containing protein n=1 Tax=Cordylochernes scorpioides TaxID=51811 RepID=A0ABY6LME5_9ARAC|nr:hypothetical protein LAZ67_21001375 [Cordylochernes scorpioides]